MEIISNQNLKSKYLIFKKREFFHAEIRLKPDVTRYGFERSVGNRVRLFWLIFKLCPEKMTIGDLSGFLAIIVRLQKQSKQIGKIFQLNLVDSVATTPRTHCVKCHSDRPSFEATLNAQLICDPDSLTIIRPPLFVRLAN